MMQHFRVRMRQPRTTTPVSAFGELELQQYGSARADERELESVRNLSHEWNE